MFARFFRQSDIPQEYRSNFYHLYLDIAWFGVLSGTSINFLNVYATRIGASGLQIGLLGAMAGIVTLFLALPSSRWLEKQHTGRAVFWSSVWFRLGYALWIPLPWLFSEHAQVWVLIALNFLMAIPLTPLGVGFNALFAEAVPNEYRAHVAGYRNATFSIAFMLTSLVAGYLLEALPFPQGYQVVFFIGAIGAAMSSYHIFHIRAVPKESVPHLTPPEPTAAKRSEPPRTIAATLRLDIWSTPFRNVLLVFFGYHLMQSLAAPLLPLYYVRGLELSDNEIGIGNAFLYFTMLIGSTQLRRLVQRVGHKTATGLGVAGMAFFPLGVALSQEVWHFYLINFIGGFIFAVSNGSHANYLLDKTPPNDRPTHLAWYNIILNVSILIGSLTGPFMADHLGLATALIVIAVFRFLSGLAVLKWG